MKIKLKRKNGKKKGQGASVIVLAILIGAFISLALAWSAHSWTIRQKVMRVNDLSVMVQAHSLGDYIKEHYINESLIYASWQKSYDLGQKGGSFGIWKENEIPKQKEIEKTLAEKISSSPYFKDFQSSQCNLSFRKPYSITFIKPFNNNSFEFKAEKNPIEVLCSREGVKVNYYVNVSRILNSYGNRYFYLYRDCYNVTNLTEQNLDKIRDPSGFYYGIFALPVESPEGNAGTIECNSETTSPIGQVIEKMSYLVAQIIAETSYRDKLIKAYKKALEETELTEETKLKLENELKLRTIDLTQQIASTFFPGIMDKLGEMKSKVKNLLYEIEGIMNEGLGSFQETEILNISKELKNSFNETVETLENIHGVLNETKKEADKLIESFGFIDKGKELRSEMKGNIDKIFEEFSYMDIISSLKKDLKSKIQNYEEEGINLIDEPIENFINSIELPKPKKSAKTQSIGLSNEEISKEELKEEVNKILDELDLGVLNEELANELKKEFHKKLEEAINETLRKKINNTIEELKENLTREINEKIRKGLHEKIKNMVSGKIKEPIKEGIRNTVEEKIGNAIDSLMDGVYEQIDSEIDKSIKETLGTNSEEINLEALVGKISEECKLPADFNISKILEKKVNETVEKALKGGIKSVVESLEKELKEKTEDVILNGLEGTINSTIDNLESNLLNVLDKETESLTNSIIEALDGPISNALNSFVDNLEKKLEEEIDNFIDNSLKKIDPILEKHNGKFQLLKPLLKEAINKAIDETYSKEKGTSSGTATNTLLIEKQAKFEAKFEKEGFKERLKANIRKAIENKIHESLFDPLYKNIDNFEPIDEKEVNNLEKSLKELSDTVFDSTEFLNDASSLKERVREEVDSKYNEVETIIDNTISQLGELVENVNIAKPLIKELEKVKEETNRNIEKILKTIEGNKDFVYHFFDHEKFLDVTIPLPTIPPTWVRTIITRVKIDPEDAYFVINDQDQKYVLPVKEGYKNLEFTCEYHYTFEGTKDNPLPKLKEA